jgi:signal transduction histidine kinase
MAVQLRLLKGLLTRSPNRAEQLADDLARQANDALVELRNLARGIFPPLLADHGLAAALQSHVDRAHAKVHLERGSGLTRARFAPELEAAAYFCIREALQNAAKHAPDAPVTVSLDADAHSLRFSVRDDGPGFDPTRVAASEGSGLVGMRDRLAALGGGFEITSAPGAGTTISSCLPLDQARVAAFQTAVRTSASKSLLET